MSNGQPAVMRVVTIKGQVTIAKHVRSCVAKLV
jgi:hypothetical protein